MIARWGALLHGLCRGRWPLLLVGLSAVANPAAVLDTLRVVMRPVHETAEVVPLVHASYAHAIAHTEWDAIGEIDIVCDQKGPAIADVDDESLVS